MEQLPGLAHNLIATNRARPRRRGDRVGVRAVMFVLGSLTMAWSHAAHAQSTTQPAEAPAPRIDLVRVKPINQDAPKPRFQLRDGVVDLTQGFSLGGSEGIGAAWKMPTTIEKFDTRYGRW